MKSDLKENLGRLTARTPSNDVIETRAYRKTDDGITWEQACPTDETGDAGCIWNARKLYGSNVLLRWYTDTDATNGEWDKLDTILSGLSG